MGIRRKPRRSRILRPANRLCTAPRRPGPAQSPCAPIARRPAGPCTDRVWHFACPLLRPWHRLPKRRNRRC